MSKNDQLFEAIRNCNVDEVLKLLKKGFLYKPAEINAKDEQGYTPLIRAIQYGFYDLAKTLIHSGADVKAVGAFGYTPLISAVWNGQCEIAEILILKGSDINATTESKGTPLIYAVRKGYLSLAELLITKGADVNVTDNDGRSPLSYSLQEGYAELTDLLISKGAKCTKAETKGDQVESIKIKEADTYLHPSEKFYTEMAKKLVHSHGQLEKITFLSAYPGFEMDFYFADGYILHSSTRTGNYDVSFLAFGYVGEGPRYLKQFLKSAGYFITNDMIKNIKPGDTIHYKDAIKDDPCHSELHTGKPQATNQKVTGMNKVSSFEYQVYRYSNIALSPDETCMVFIQCIDGDRYKLVSIDVKSDETKWEKNLSVYKRIELAYISSDKVIMISENTEEQSSLTLINSSSGAFIFNTNIDTSYKLIEYWDANLREFMYSNPAIKAAVREGGDWSICKMTLKDDDTIEIDIVKFGQVWQSPVIDNMSNIYCSTSTTTYKINPDGKKVEISSNTSSNTCLSQQHDKVFVGSGYDDKSDEAYLDVVDIEQEKSTMFHFGDDPIHDVRFVKDDELILSSIYNTTYSHILSYAHVTYVSLSSKRVVWKRKITNLSDMLCPTILLITEIESCLIHGNNCIELISLHDGKAMCSIDNKSKDVIRAIFVKVSSSLYLYRYPTGSNPRTGVLEKYELTY